MTASPTARKVQPLRVLWLSKGLGRGGAERLLTFAVPYLDPRRIAVEVAYILPHKRHLVGQFRSHGIPVHRLAATAHDPGWVWRLRHLVEEQRFDIVHTHSPLPAGISRMVLRPYRAMLVHTEHNVWERYRWPTFALNAATYGRNAAVIAVSDGVARSIRRPHWMPWLTLPEVRTVRHGIDESQVRRGPDARRAARARLGLRGDRTVVGTVGNMTAKKDQATLIHALDLVRQPGTDVQLVLVGSGPLEGHLRRLVSDAGMGEWVLFTGTRDDVQSLLPAFDVFALSSRHEGLSIALVEAMAAGLPCVATRVGGVPEVLNDGRDGFMVNPGDAAALANAIHKLVVDPDLRARMGEQAKDNAKRFSIRNAVSETMALYEQVTGRAA